MTLASSAADINVTSGTGAAQALTAAGTLVAFCQPGETVSIALAAPTAAFEWSIGAGPNGTDNYALAAGVLGEFFNKKFYSPTSSTTVTFTMPQVPMTLNFFSEVTDGHNVLRTPFSIQSRQSGANLLTSANVRYVVVANVASLAAYTVADTEATGVQGDRVLLANQTTGAQGGIYEIGVVAAGTAPLTRVGDMPTGATLAAGFTVKVSEGVSFANTEWFMANTGIVTVGTTTLAQAATTGFYPRMVNLRTAMTTGTATISTVPIRALASTSVHGTACVIGGTTTLSTLGFRTGVGATGAEGITAGKVGTAAIICFWSVAAGTVNAADTSTAQVTISQR